MLQKEFIRQKNCSSPAKSYESLAADLPRGQCVGPLPPCYRRAKYAAEICPLSIWNFHGAIFRWLSVMNFQGAIFQCHLCMVVCVVFLLTAFLLCQFKKI
jgi:hypothetical protein